MSSPDRILAGVALMIGFCISAPLIDVASKLAAQAEIALIQQAYEYEK